MRLVLLMILSVVILSSCNRRQAAKGDVSFLDKRIENKDSLLKFVGDSIFDQNYFSFKSDLVTDFTGSEVEINMTAKVVLDSAIEIRLKKAGIPLLKALITKDSIFIRNDFNEKSVRLMDYLDLEKLIEVSVDYDLIQKLVLGKPYYYYAVNQYKYHEDKPYHLLTSIGKRRLERQLKQEENPEAIFGEVDEEDQEILIQALWFNGLERSLASMFVKEPKENRKLWLDYQDKIYLNGQSIPKNIEIGLKIKNNKKKHITVKHTKLYAKDPFKLKFKVPSKYEIIR